VQGRYDPFGSVEALIDAGCNVNLRNLNGNTALHLLTRTKFQKPSITALLASGADLTVVNYEEESLLHAGCQSDTVDNVEALVDAGCDTNALDGCGSTIFHYVRSHSVLQLILKARVPPSLKTIKTQDMDGDTPLHLIVAERNNAEMIHTMLVAGANPNLTNNTGQSLLHVAVSSTNFEILLNAGCDRNALDNFDRTILHQVTNFDVLWVILRCNNPPTIQTINQKDKNGNTCLHIYVINGNAHLELETVYREGVDLNATNNLGQSCLHSCALNLQWFSMRTVKFLVENGADIFLQDLAGKTPFDVLYENQGIDEGSFERIRNYLDDEMNNQRKNQSFKRVMIQGIDEGEWEEGEGEEGEGEEGEGGEGEGGEGNEEGELQEEDDEGGHTYKKARVSLGDHGEF
jgi:hypothetical protein